MISIGNDIVDLNSINRARTCELRFYSKFVTTSELSLFEQADITRIPFENYVWMLWSVKESTYKFLKRHQPDLVFSPIKIIVNSIALSKGHYFGEVVHNTVKLHFKSTIRSSVVATLVNNDPCFENIHWEISAVQNNAYQHQSRKVREMLIDKFSSLYPEQNIVIKKSPVGYPIILQNGIDTNMVVSLAHHGLYTSYCFKLPH